MNVFMNDFGLDRYKICWRLWLRKLENLKIYLIWELRPFVMYYAYVNVRAIPTYRVYRLCDMGVSGPYLLIESTDSMIICFIFSGECLWCYSFSKVWNQALSVHLAPCRPFWYNRRMLRMVHATYWSSTTPAPSAAPGYGMGAVCDLNELEHKCSHLSRSSKHRGLQMFCCFLGKQIFSHGLA